MKSKWKHLSLGAICKISSSKRIFAKEYVTRGIPFFRGKEIIEKQQLKSISTDLYISESRYREIRDRYGCPSKGDLLLTSVGTLGIPYICNEETFYFKDGNITWFHDFNGVDSRFLYYWFLSPEGKRNIDMRCIGSTQKALPIDVLTKFSIFLPPIDEQKAIVAILSSLDAKIESNAKINHHLEEIAQAIFKSWFVDNASKDVHSLSEFFSFVKGKKPPIMSETPKFGYLPYLTIDALTSNTSNFASAGNMVTSEASDILMVMDGASSGTVYNGKLGVIGSTFAKVDVRDSQMREVVYQALKYFDDDIRNHNTGSAIPHTDKGFVLQLKIALPADIDEVAKQFGSLRRSVIANTEQSARLAALRDALLPRLMSGELSVRANPSPPRFSAGERGRGEGA